MRAFLVAALAFVAVPAWADCSTLEKVQEKAPSATMAPLSEAEFHFLQGIYALNPLTPPGLPPGTSALLMRKAGNPGALVFWISGQLVCDPMEVPDKLLEMLPKVKAGEGGDAL